VHQSDNKEFDISDARCNHEDLRIFLNNMLPRKL